MCTDKYKTRDKQVQGLFKDDTNIAMLMDKNPEIEVVNSFVLEADSQ